MLSKNIYISIETWKNNVLKYLDAIQRNSQTITAPETSSQGLQQVQTLEGPELLENPQCSTGDFHQRLTSKANLQAKNPQGFFLNKTSKQKGKQ